MTIKFFDITIHGNTMLKNYIKVAVRNFLKYKIYSVANILGLSVGIACTTLLVLFVQHELSYDDYHENADRIYRVAASYKFGGQSYELASTPAPLAKTLLEEFPEIEKTVRFRGRGGNIVKYKKNVFKEQGMIYADNSFFDVFSISLIHGDQNEVLIRPGTVTISEKAASKYFGSEDPIGKIIRVGDQSNFEVTGVFEEIPVNTHFHFDFILSMESLDEAKENVWLGNNFNTYFMLRSNSSPEQLEEKFNALLEKYLGPDIEAAMGMTLEDLSKKGGKAAFYLQPVTDIHLYSDLDSELGANSDIKYVYIFSIIAIFILAIASINFMNISTARSATRAKEVGIRKVLGSNRHELIIQFLSESFLTTFVSLFVSFGIVELALPLFNNLTGLQLPVKYLGNPQLILLFVGILIFMGLLAGSYPAFVLSAFNPSGVFSGKIKNNTKSGFFRSGLVIFQFAASIVLIIATIVVIKQLEYIQTKKLGFDKDHVIILKDAYLLGDQVETFRNEMLNYEEVINASISGFLPVPSDNNNSGAFPEGKSEQLVAINQWSVDYDYVKTMRIEITKGRDFSEEFGSDKENILVNEAVVKLFGYENPIGERLSRFISNQGDIKTYTIIGVMKDFHFESLRNNIEPLMFYLGNNTGSISFRTTGKNIAVLINDLKTKWEKFVPNQPFNYSFLDEKFNQMYSSEQKTSDIFGVFSGLAIFISCLGLFSLSAFSAEQKTKEIGIRKVLGSTVFSIVYLLASEFLKLILIAFAVAASIAYYFMNNWLLDFAYRTSLSVWVFITAGFIAFFIAMLTVSYQAVKAAMANPVESLRDE